MIQHVKGLEHLIIQIQIKTSHLIHDGISNDVRLHDRLWVELIDVEEFGVVRTDEVVVVLICP